MSERLPPLSALRVFEAAARRLNFRQAAEDLFVTPGAVSQQIRLLEEHVGVQLFVREGRGVALTEAGKAALPALRLGFEKLAEAARLMRQPQRRHRVTVSAAPSFAAKWLVPRLERFSAGHPEVEVWLAADMALTDFAATDVDLAIRYGSGAYRGLATELLLGETVLPVCAPSLLEAAPIRAPRDLLNHVLLHDVSPSEDDGAPDWAAWLKAHGVEGAALAAKGPRFNQSSLVIEAALAGRGVALAKRALAEGDLHGGRLAAPLGAGSEALAFGYYLVWPAGRQFTPAQSAFLAWLRQEAGHRADPTAAGAGLAAEPAEPPPVFAGTGI
jgi:LysR family glycine cleavage system transcriptional activator